MGLNIQTIFLSIAVPKFILDVSTKVHAFVTEDAYTESNRQTFVHIAALDLPPAYGMHTQ
jgi:hypothetical protein